MTGTKKKAEKTKLAPLEKRKEEERVERKTPEDFEGELRWLVNYCHVDRTSKTKSPDRPWSS